MFLNSSQVNCNIIQPLPCFRTTRFGRQIGIDDDNDGTREYKVLQPPILSTNADASSSILITGIRNRDWNFYDDHQDFNDKDLSTINYQSIPSISNTIKNRSTNSTIDNNISQYEEYDLDEQDFQWLIAYNRFRIEKHLPELDENIFEYIIQLLEQQCLLAVRQKNYGDIIQCDACHRIDDVDDLIQCIQCKTIVHKKCYGINEHANEWICISCQCDNEQHQCCLCGKSEGALKYFKSSSDQRQWVHLSCAFWFPKIEFDETMTPILKDILQCERRCLICYKTIGVTINCSWKNCQNRFHALCAMNIGQDMFIAENDDQNSIRLLALCHRHTEKLDLLEKRVRMTKFLEKKQKRFEQFASYINLDTVKQQTLILPDVIESIHAYWILKRQGNNCQPLIDIPDDIFYHEYDKSINLVEYSRQYHLDHKDQTADLIEQKPNVLQFLATNSMLSIPTISNLFVKYAQRNRITFSDYERSLFCLLDTDKKKRKLLLENLASIKTNF